MQWKTVPNACSEKLCLMHAVEKQDTQLVVEKLNFAVEKQCVWCKNS
jgi:hypothetical protein